VRSDALLEDKRINVEFFQMTKSFGFRTISGDERMKTFYSTVEDVSLLPINCLLLRTLSEITRVGFRVHGGIC